MILQFILFVPVALIGTAISYPLVPLAVAFANSEGRLPRWAQWLETPDALGWVSEDKYGNNKKYALTRWLWRNAAYRLKFWMGMNVAGYDYSQVTFSSSGDYEPKRWGPSLWQARAVYKGRTYFDIRPAFGFGKFYIYILIGWKLKPYISGYFPTGPNAAGMFAGITPRTDNWG